MKSHNYKVRMRLKTGGLYTITRNAVSPTQAMRFAEDYTNVPGRLVWADAVRAWKNSDAPDPRDWKS